MKKVLEFLKNWFEKNGLIKILIAFAVLIGATILAGIIPEIEKPLALIACFAGGYLVVTAAVFTIAGIVNWIKDIKKFRK